MWNVNVLFSMEIGHLWRHLEGGPAWPWARNVGSSPGCSSTHLLKKSTVGCHVILRDGETHQKYRFTPFGDCRSFISTPPNAEDLDLRNGPRRSKRSPRYASLGRSGLWPPLWVPVLAVGVSRGRRTPRRADERRGVGFGHKNGNDQNHNNPDSRPGVFWCATTSQK